MIQDIYPNKLYNEYRPGKKPLPQSRVICFQGKKVLVRKNESAKILEFPAFSQLYPGMDPDEVCSPASKDMQGVVYAFAVDDTEYFLDVTDKIHSLEDFEYLEIRSVRGYSTNLYGMVVFTGTHLHQWYCQTRYCGSCGSPLIHSESERALHCPNCGKNIYPRLMPAVIVGVTNGDKLLVTKYKEGFKYYALVAGFTEIGETLEETVAREVKEETGLNVKNIRYYKSQPWGIVQDLLAGFYCDVDGSSEIKMDENELKLAQWKSRSEIELQPDSYSLTNEMMKMFKEGKI